jgi:hypothetical protein
VEKLLVIGLLSASTMLPIPVLDGVNTVMRDDIPSNVSVADPTVIEFVAASVWLPKAPIVV